VEGSILKNRIKMLDEQAKAREEARRAQAILNNQEVIRNNIFLQDFREKQKALEKEEEAKIEEYKLKKDTITEMRNQRSEQIKRLQLEQRQVLIDRQTRIL